MKPRISSRAPGGRSWATPPGRMNAWFIRRPVISSNRSSTSSRSRKPMVITVSAPISMPPVAMQTRCEEIRLSSMSRTRITLAFSGMSSSMSRSRSTPRHVGRLVEERRQVVHAGDERRALHPGAELHVLLDAGVQVADAAPGLGDRLALDLEDQPQHAVGRGVLRTHVDDDALLDALTVVGRQALDDLVPVAAADGEDLALGGLAAAGVDVVGGAHANSPKRDGVPVELFAGGAKRGRRRTSWGVISCTTCAGRAAGWCRPCTRRGCRRGGSPCAAGGPASRRASGSGSTRGGRRR